jgi:hypothetical protein
MCEEHAIRLTCFEVQPQLESEWCWGGFQAGLEREDHFDDQYRDLLYAHTPILREPPDDLEKPRGMASYRSAFLTLLIRIVGGE